VQLAFDDTAPANSGTITEDTTPSTQTSGNGNNIGSDDSCEGAEENW
jgi:hypothetical protein